MGSGLEELGIVDDNEDGVATPEAEAASDRESDPLTPEEARRSRIHELLQRVTLFEGLLGVHLRRISALAHEIDYQRGDFIFSHNDDSDGLYLVVTGAVRISRSVSGMGEEALAILKPGTYFGEMSIIDDDIPRSADAIAHESSRLIKLPKDDLRDLMFVDRELAYELLWRFVRTLSSRLRESNDRLLMLTVSSKF